MKEAANIPAQPAQSVWAYVARGPLMVIERVEAGDSKAAETSQQQFPENPAVLDPELQPEYSGTNQK